MRANETHYRAFEEILEPFGSEEFGGLARLERRSLPTAACDCLPAVAFGEGGSENEAKTQKNRCLFFPRRMAAVFLKMP